MNMSKVTCKSSTFVIKPYIQMKLVVNYTSIKPLFFFLQVGGEAVNLIARDKPADVYTSIADR